MQVTISGPVARQIEKLAETTKRQPATIVKEIVKSYMDARAQAIQEGFESGEKEGWVSHEKVMAGVDRILKKHERKARKAA
jgi:predicted transcriptional regulator